MPEKKMWMVRAGEGAYAIEDFRSKSLVAIGWADEGSDWTKFSNRDGIQAQIAKEIPDHTETQCLVAASQIERFLRELEVGDRVISYDPDNRVYLLGTIASQPKHQSGLIDGLETYRSVTWGKVEVPRDELSAPTRNSLGAISTLFRIPDTAAAEIEAKAAGRPTPQVVETDPVREEVDLLKDVQARSREFVKDRLSRLDWDQMQTLVAGLLRAMGYKTRISPAGPDRGKDIVASPDGFGFEPPRIVVEVKHRKGQMGSQEIRSFLGGRHKDDKGLYVSTGGFSKDAHYEADRSSIPLTLMDMDDLAKAVAEYYDRMDSETQALIPMIRIYWPR
jgi:restriction system protein